MGDQPESSDIEQLDTFLDENQKRLQSLNKIITVKQQVKLVNDKSVFR